MTVAHEVNVSALTSEEGLKATKASLSAVPDAKVVYANLDDFLTGVVQAINEAGRGGQITVTGFDGIPSTLAMVRDGRVGFEIALQPKKWGATALRTMAASSMGRRRRAW
ncbi:substrate-binding domain-containing protein [Actinomadura madurae]|nr:substrate-binding domain-containing protein [Actinomadura madurae]